MKQQPQTQEGQSMPRRILRIAATCVHRQGDSSPAIIAVVLLLAVAGGLIGYLLPLQTADAVRPATATAPAAMPGATTGSLPQQMIQIAAIHRFELTAADMTETAEAPSLAIDDAGRVILAFATQIGEADCALLLADSRDGGATFSEPQAVLSTGIHTTVSESRGRRIERRTRMLPHIATWQDRLFLSWVSAGEAREDVVMQFAESTNGGATWSGPIDVHQNRDARPTFTGMGVGDDGTVVCSWLDNRNGVQQPFAALRRAEEAEFAPEQMVYAGTEEAGICPCCPTNAFVSGDDVLVAFRGNEAGFRDMWIARLDTESNAFAAPECVIDPTWEFPGCPHDGPSMARTPSGLHLAWMDAHTGLERVYLTTMPSEHPDGESRGEAVAFPAEDDITQGHPQIVADGARLHIVWDQSLPNTHETPQDDAADEASVDTTAHGHGVEADGAGRAIYHAYSDDGGASFSTPTPLAPQPGSFQSRPQVAVGPDHSVYVAWMELSDEGKVVVLARLLDDEVHVPQLAAEGRD